MAGRVLSFFSKQLRAGSSGASGIYYSEVFEVPAINKIIAEFRVHTISGGNSVTGVIQDSFDPTNDAAWNDALTFTSSTLTGAKNSISDFQRFIRGKLSLPPGNYSTISFDGIGREL